MKKPYFPFIASLLLSLDSIRINENIILFTYSQYVKVNSKSLIFVKYFINFILISYAREIIVTLN